MKKLTAASAYIANANSIFNIITELPQPVRSVCNVEMTTGMDKGVMLTLSVGPVIVGAPNDGRFKGILQFGEDHLKSSSDKDFLQEMAKCKWGLFRTWEDLFQLLVCHAPTSLSQMNVYAVEGSISFGRIFLNKDMIVFTYSKSDAYAITNSEKEKEEFGTFLEKALTPVSDIDYGEPYA